MTFFAPQIVPYIAFKRVPQMPQTGKLKTIEKDHEEPLLTLIPRVIREEGSIYKAAVRLDVSPNTLQHWLKKEGFHVTTRQVATVERENDPGELEAQS
jgi:hypothetical protein